MIDFQAIDEGEDPYVLLDLALSERIEHCCSLAPPTSTKECLVLAVRDEWGRRSLAISPVQAQRPHDEQEMHIAYTTDPSSDISGAGSQHVSRKLEHATAALKIDARTVAIGYGEGTGA